jgi:DNA-directed RNA polymerase subunit beta'
MRNNSSAIHTLEDVYEELEKNSVKLNTKYSYSNPKKTENKVVNMNIGRIWFNLLLPDKYPLINEKVDKKLLSKIINEIYEKYPLEEATKTVNDLNEHSFKMSSICPVSFNIDELIVPQEIREQKKKVLNENIKPEEFTEKLTDLSNEYLDILGNKSGIKQIIDSGAKGKPTDFGVLMLAKGPVVDIEGNVSKPILTGQTDGYSGEEYYTLAGESRRSLYIRGIGTADPGELSRDVTYANSNTEINKDDCNVKRYLEIKVTALIFKTLQGRYFMNDKTNKLTKITSKSTGIINKKIKLRSPLYCRDKKGICSTCYGDLAKKLDTKHIGFLSGQVINQAGVEGYSMAVRHQSLQVSLQEVDFPNDLVQI